MLTTAPMTGYSVRAVPNWTVGISLSCEAVKSRTSSAVFLCLGSSVMGGRARATARLAGASPVRLTLARSPTQLALGRRFTTATEAKAMNALTVLSSEIRQFDGLYSLNDLHQAAGGSAKHRPNQFMRLDTTQALMEEIRCADVRIIPAKTVRGRGKPQGTYVCKELVYAYAMWISPSFHLKVIRAFDALQGQPSTASPRALPEEVIKAVNSKAHAMSAGHYAGLRDAILDRISKMATDDHGSLVRAVNDYTDSSLVPFVICKREKLAGKRLLISVSDDGASYVAKPIPNDCYILSLAQIARGLGIGQDLPFSPAQLAQVIEGASGRLARVLGQGRA